MMISTASQDQGHPSWDSCRLWSLWEMLKLKVASFYEVSTNLQEFQSLTKYGNWNKDEILEPNNKSHLGPMAIALGQHLNVLGAKNTAKAAIRLSHVISKPGSTWGEVAEMQDHLDLRLLDEMSDKNVLVLDGREEAFFNPEVPLFGGDFDTKFKTDGIFELDEGAKCMALGRPTAGVFHLMRVLELGIRAIARCLQIPDPLKPAERNWGHILKEIWSGIEEKWPKASDRMAGDGALFEALFASLDAVKNPWRNATMHVENKYTDDEADHIFIAVKGFMKKLASRMDEDGLPLV